MMIIFAIILVLIMITYRNKWINRKWINKLNYKENELIEIEVDIFASREKKI